MRNTASAGSYWHKNTGQYENTLRGYPASWQRGDRGEADSVQISFHSSNAF